ncbi:DASH family cryptochrome [Haloglomus salinum]|uniref:DASH family cryptochrome n=1 Tax=Haloglomus salinum TaxID=2962673 RepID=UPI0020C9E514|nr:DASH family cryptochrome [Haloglomus salinum]
MSETAVVWFRDDLRVHDNETLNAAVAGAERVVPLYVFDEREHAGTGMFDLSKKGARWGRFRREAVVDLRASLRDLGGDLLVRHGDPRAVVPAVAETVDADTVHLQTKPATEELADEHAVQSLLADRGIDTERHWTHTLYHVDDLPTPSHDIHDTFTPWREEVEREATVRAPLSTPAAVTTPPLGAAGDADVPSLEELGHDPADASYDDRGVLAFEGGETAALERLDDYIWDGDHLRKYKETRNGLLGADYSSKFSAWLAHGCLSPRRVHAAVERYEDERVANEDTYWLVFELLWRDFFQFQFVKHGADFFRPNGIRDVEKEWRRGPEAREAFERWAAGETGVPFVDANMRELNATGYMSNRGRQNVASFLADAMGVDWRLGAAYFESRLVDYDVASNWGNWAYQAGVGNDSRDNYFDVLAQAEHYDPGAEYVTHWLPELDGLPAEYAHRPWRLSAAGQERHGVVLGRDYPEPPFDVAERFRKL